MKLLPKNPEKIINDFFVSIQGYIQALLDEKADLMAGLTDFVYKAWEIPKAYKGQSSQMGFIPEYLVFETLKQYLQRKNNLSFISLVRTKTHDDQVETNYFVDSPKAPCHLLSQGFRPYGNNSNLKGLPLLDYAHDVCYLVRENNWAVKAIIEVKGYFDKPTLETDLNRLKHAENNYPLTANYALVFVGFKIQDQLTIKEKELINTFTQTPHHFCVLPGETKSDLGNSSLVEILNLIS